MCTQSWVSGLYLAFLFVPLALCAAGMFLGWTLLGMGRKTRDGKVVEPPLWLRQVAERARRLSRPQLCFDAAQLGDPLATSIDWTLNTARHPGYQSRPRRLVVIDPERLEYRPGIRDLLEPLILFCMALAMCFNGVVAALYSAVVAAAPFVKVHPFANLTIDLPTRLLVLFVPMLFAVVWMIYRMTPVVFDKRVGVFWKGRKVPGEIGGETTPKHALDLREIHALQIVSGWVRGQTVQHRVHQLNLVLNDGTRWSLGAAGDPFKVRREAALLAEFLGKPVWDATRA